MAVRTVRVGPDEALQTRSGEQIAVVSRSRQIQAIADFVTLCDVAGGTFGVLYGRTSTGLPGEMATTELLIHWRDRGDAKEQHEETIRFEEQSGVSLFSEEGIDTELVPEPEAV